MKETVFKSEARQHLANGINAINAAVSVTLGPRGRNVIISQDGGVAITKDGVTVAKYFEMPDHMENVGAQMIKQVASKVALEAGDGTTTATVLAHGIFTEGNRHVEMGAHPMDIKKGIDIGMTAIVEALKSQAKSVSTIEEIRQVATISANNDEEIGSLIATAMEKVGFQGIITAGESKTGTTFVETVEGVQFGNGYLSPYFVTNQEKNTVEFANPLVLLYDGKISNLQDILHFLEYSNQTKRPLLIISESVDGEALNTLLVNKLRGAILAVAVKAPGFGESRRTNLEDIAILTGATLISEMDGVTIREAVSNKYLGGCSEVVVHDNKTVIVGGSGKPDQIAKRADEIRNQIEVADESRKIILKERLSKFEGGVAIIKIGAKSEIEAREKADRIDDALGATRAAVAEGVVAGGGLALIKAIESVNIAGMNRDINLGIEIVKDACKKPFISILANAGISHEVVLNNIKNGQPGFNVKTEEYVDMIESGIIDPVKVTRTALENAVSIAGLLLTTDCMMVQQPADKK